MVSLYGLRAAREERSRERMVKQLRLERRAYARPLDETQRRLEVLETLRQWGVMDEDEYLEQKRDLAS
jgi:hypothetical protein